MVELSTEITKVRATRIRIPSARAFTPFPWTSKSTKRPIPFPIALATDLVQLHNGRSSTRTWKSHHCRSTAAGFSSSEILFNITKLRSKAHGARSMTRCLSTG